MQPYWIGTLWTSRNCKKCSWMWLPSASVSKAQTSSTSAAPISTHFGVLPNSVLQIIWCLETKQVLTATWHMSHMRYPVKCKQYPLAWKILEHIRELSQEKQLQTQDIQLEIICQKKWNIMKISDIETLNRSLKKIEQIFLISADFLHRFLYFRPGLGAEVQGLRSVGALCGTTGHTSNMRNGISTGYVGIHWDHIRDRII